MYPWKTQIFDHPGKMEQGFTLVEVLVALLMGGIVLSAVMSSFSVQHKTYLVQDEVVAMQQNARVAMDILVRDIRLAGYDPKSTAGADITTATSDQITISMDLDGDGTLSASENVTYAISTSTKTLGRDIGSGLHRVAENVPNLEFYYLLEDGTRTLAPADLTKIRGVQISLLARTEVADQNFTDTTTYTPASGSVDPGWGPFNDGFRRQLLIQTVICRNMGLGP